MSPEGQLPGSSMGRGTSIRSALVDLRRAQKSNRGAPAYSRWVNRPLGRLIAAVAYTRGWHPNHLTAVSAVLTLMALVSLAALPARSGTGLLVALLLVCGYAFDAGDGQLARLRGGGTPAGEWLDHVIDCSTCATIHVVVLVSWYRFFGIENPLVFLIPLAFSVQSSVWFFAIHLTQQLRKSAHGVEVVPVGQPAPALRSLLVIPADYGVLCLSFVLLGWHQVFLVVYTVLMASNVLFLLLSVVRWYRDVRTLPTAATRPAGGVSPNAS